MNNRTLATAIALALGTGVAAQSAMGAAATPAQCAAATQTLYVAGSSAAQPSFATALASDLFDANGETTFSAPGVSGVANGNFRAYCGFAKSGNGAGLATGSVAIVYYRAEGGSVVGALPIVSGKPVKELTIQPASCQVTNPSVTGLSATVGTTDGWTGCVTTHAVEMGVTDVEPTQFFGQNYPTAYSTSVFGSASVSQFGNLSITPIFQQVFGIFVNTSGFSGGGTGQAVDLSRTTVGDILAGNIVNWSAVPTSTGGQVSTSSSSITIVNREAGSGTRTGASTYFLQTNCTAFGPNFGTLSDPNPLLDGYATGDVLATAATIPGAITYASIDNNGKQANLTLASLNGVKPTNIAATSGTYEWWEEATVQQGAASSTGGTLIYNWLTGGELQNLTSAPHAVDINTIPFAGTSNSNGVPVATSTVNGVTIYTNPYTKAGNSCNQAS